MTPDSKLRRNFKAFYLYFFYYKNIILFNKAELFLSFVVEKDIKKQL